MERLINRSDSSTSKDLAMAFFYINNFSHSERKKIISCCRSQTIPFPLDSTQLSRNIGFDGCTSARPGLCTKHRNLHDYFSRFQEYIQSPDYAGMIIDFCICRPFNPEETEEIKRSAFAKEIRVMESEPLPSSFNYQVFFDPLRFNERLHHSTPPNPEMACLVYEILCRWRANQSGRIYYPRRSGKKVARSTISHWERLEGREWDEEMYGTFSQHVIEKYEHETGHSLEGPCEMRQKWYRSGITPRTYYAMGGTAYRLSKHLQGAFGDLVDLLPSTNHTLRLNPTRILLEEDEHLFIYDLFAFSSNYHEQRHFLDALAEFCFGTKVIIVDAVDGMVEVDLGRLISDYNQMNTLPEYSLERVSLEYQDRVQRQHIAGFLGVYGNLMTCTFIHGASVLQLVIEPSRLNVAGDDGHFARNRFKPLSDDIPMIRANGVLETSKTFSTEEDGSICLKRGLVQVEGRLFQKRMLVWPSLGLVAELLGSPIEHLAPSKKTKEELREAVSLEVLRFLTALHFLEEIDCYEEVLSYLKTLYRLCELPTVGSVPQLEGTFLCPILPTTLGELSYHPLQYLLSYHWKGAALVPKRLRDTTMMPQVVRWEEGFVVERTLSPFLSYMDTLGYIELLPCELLVFGESGFDRLMSEFLDFSPRVYDVRVVGVPGSQFFTLPEYSQFSNLFAEDNGVYITA